MAKDLLYHHADKTKAKISKSLKEYFECAKTKGQKGDCYTFCPCAKRETDTRKVFKFNTKLKKVMFVAKNVARKNKDKFKPMSNRNLLKFKSDAAKKEHKKKYDKERYAKIKAGQWKKKD